jgi:hypothetical protein
MKTEIYDVNKRMTAADFIIESNTGQSPEICVAIREME